MPKSEHDLDLSITDRLSQRASALDGNKLWISNSLLQLLPNELKQGESREDSGSFTTTVGSRVQTAL